MNDTDQSAPIETKSKCEKCGTQLGCQDPGDACSTCKFIALSDIERSYRLILNSRSF